MGETPQLNDVEKDLLVGVLIGEGHFGGDGRYPQMWLGANGSSGPNANMLFQLPALTPEARGSKQ